MASRRIPQILLPAAVAGSLLAVAAPAAADDAGVFNAYVARQPTDLKAANRAWHDAFRVVKRSDGERGVRGVIRANEQINAVLTTIEGELNAQAPSSEIGTRAHRNAIREVRGWRRANGYENRAWRRSLAGRSSKRHFDRALDEFLRAFRQGQRAIRRFAKLGLSSPERAITQSPERG
jgi:hypothetical protein